MTYQSPGCGPLLWCGRQHLVGQLLHSLHTGQGFHGVLDHTHLVLYGSDDAKLSAEEPQRAIADDAQGQVKLSPGVALPRLLQASKEPKSGLLRLSLLIPLLGTFFLFWNVWLLLSERLGHIGQTEVHDFAADSAANHRSRGTTERRANQAEHEDARRPCGKLQCLGRTLSVAKPQVYPGVEMADDGACVDRGIDHLPSAPQELLLRLGGIVTLTQRRLYQ
mmetsp:Transcript_54134/g.136237  ORF Transcript_54134/g.136237 Transcript_54134/m.136237 type:complete len:221 (+) Transcript_54134:389-1051(+)